MAGQDDLSIQLLTGANKSDCCLMPDTYCGPGECCSINDGFLRTQYFMVVPSCRIELTGCMSCQDKLPRKFIGNTTSLASEANCEPK